MNNNGIACTFNDHEGRVKNLRYDPINDEVIGDFYYRGHNSATKVNALQLSAKNNKAKTALSDEINAIIEKQQKKKVKKELILD